MDLVQQIKINPRYIIDKELFFFDNVVWVLNIIKMTIVKRYWMLNKLIKMELDDVVNSIYMKYAYNTKGKTFWKFLYIKYKQLKVKKSRKLTSAELEQLVRGCLIRDIQQFNYGIFTNVTSRELRKGYIHSDEEVVNKMNFGKSQTSYDLALTDSDKLWEFAKENGIKLTARKLQKTQKETKEILQKIYEQNIGETYGKR